MQEMCYLKMQLLSIRVSVFKAVCQCKERDDAKDARERISQKHQSSTGLCKKTMNAKTLF